MTISGIPFPAGTRLAGTRSRRPFRTRAGRRLDGSDRTRAPGPPGHPPVLPRRGCQSASQSTLQVPAQLRPRCRRSSRVCPHYQQRPPRQGIHPSPRSFPQPTLHEIAYHSRANSARNHETNLGWPARLPARRQIQHQARPSRTPPPAHSETEVRASTHPVAGWEHGGRRYTTVVKQPAQYGPCADARREWRAPREYACAVGSRAFWPDAGCSAGRSACSPVTPRSRCQGTRARPEHATRARSARPRDAVVTFWGKAPDNGCCQAASRYGAVADRVKPATAPAVPPPIVTAHLYWTNCQFCHINCQKVMNRHIRIHLDQSPSMGGPKASNRGTTRHDIHQKHQAPTNEYAE